MAAAVSQAQPDPLLTNLTSLATSFSNCDLSKATQTFDELQALIHQTGELISREMGRSPQTGANKLWTQFIEGFVEPTDAKIQSAIRSIVTLSHVVHICAQLEMNAPDPLDDSLVDPATETLNSERSDSPPLSQCSDDSLVGR